MKPTRDVSDNNGFADRRLGLGLALFSALALLVVLLTAGCTSDEPNVVGTALVTDQIDTILVPLGVEEVSNYSAQRVENPDIPIVEQEVLYIGEQAGTRSGAILANFDFSDIFTSEFPESLFTEENISSVKYSLIKLKYYSASTDSIQSGMPVDLYYEVQQLESPFIPSDYENYVVQTPEPFGQILNSDYTTPNSFNEVNLRFYHAAEFLGWVANRDSVGIIVTLGSQSDPGLIGFAAKELSHFSELDPLEEKTIWAPHFVVKFVDETFFVLGPYADTSTFEQVPDPPADVDSGFLLRTGLRSYPCLLFDLSGLPPNAFINRALLSVTNDTTVAFGNLGGISILEWDEVRFGDPYRTTTVDELNDPSDRYSFYVTGQSSLDPTLDTTIQFDVTQAILRVINQVYSGTRGFLLSAGEDYFREGAATSVTPDFYYREFRFMGTAAEDPSMRPQLKITYSLVEELDGEGK